MRMKIEISQQNLHAAVTAAAAVADRNGTNPILGHVLISASGDTATFASTDMSITVRERYHCTATKTGKITVPAKHMRRVVSTLAGPVTLEATDSSWLIIKAGRTEFRLMGMDATDFPDLPDVPGDLHGVDAVKLAGLIDKTIFSVSTDVSRMNLNGALFSVDRDTATMVSTDGHRLTKCTTGLGHNLGGTLTRGVVIPRRGLEELRKLAKGADQIAIGVEDMHLFAEAGDASLSVRLNNATFPPWQQVVPKSHDRRVVVDREALLAGLRQAVVIAPEKTATVRMAFEQDTIELRADNPVLGAIKLDVPADMTGTPMVSGFNGAYMIDALSVFDDDLVWLEFQGELDPCVIRRPTDDPSSADSLLAVVMPMRI